MGDRGDFHPLVFACATNKLAIAKLIMRKKNVFENYEKLLSLGINIQHGNIRFINHLINEGASVNSLCVYCRNAPPIAVALAYNQYDVFRLLLSKKANLYNPSAGYDVIAAAAKCDSLSVLKELVERYELDVNQTNSKGVSTIMFALSANKLDNIKYLIEKGASPSLLDVAGDNILTYCKNKESFQYCKQLLKESGEEFKYPTIHQIIEKDDKSLFDYYVDIIPESINQTELYRDAFEFEEEELEEMDLGMYDLELNAYYALFFTEKNTSYFAQKLKSMGLELEYEENINSKEYDLMYKELKKLLKKNS